MKKYFYMAAPIIIVIFILSSILYYVYPRNKSILVCLPNENEHLIYDKFAFEQSILNCGAADGSIIIESSLDYLYEEGYRIKQIIVDDNKAVYYLIK